MIATGLDSAVMGRLLKTKKLGSMRAALKQRRAARKAERMSRRGDFAPEPLEQASSLGA